MALLVDAAIVAIAFGAIQLIPVARDNPPVVREPSGTPNAPAR